MASILKIPSLNSKGIITFTSREIDEFILNDKDIYSRINNLKDKWILGVHHNWHNFNFKSNDLFDFNMAGETDLKSVDEKEYCHIPIECTHFTQNFFKFSNDSKTWDILYVGRGVNFKRIPEFFKIIRSLYDQGKMYRVLFICPIPPRSKINSIDSGIFNDIREVYNEMFKTKERHFFNLLTLDFEYPFPFDLETLSHFYKSSRIMVFTSDDERRPRTVAYAIASGMPVVLMASVASLLPSEKHIKPLVYLADNFKQFPSLIIEAISFTQSEKYNKSIMSAGIQEFSEVINIDRLREIFLNIFKVDLYEDSRKYSLLYDLDIRLARHYGFGDNRNSIDWNLKSFINYLENRNHYTMLKDVSEFKDFELDISHLSQYKEKEDINYFKIFKNKLFEIILFIYRRSSLLRYIYRSVR